MSNIRDVAKLAGVAPITVSRVINNSGYITDETRQRVEEAIRSLGYVPNSLARSLRSHKTRMLALVLTDITNPFWTTVARGVEDAASDAGFSVILCNTDESAVEQERYIRVILEKQVDGVLLVPAGDPREPVRTIRSQQTPVVVLDRCVPTDLDTDVVRCDSVRGAYE
jgi:LacI family transcriptional regulator